MKPKITMWILVTLLCIATANAAIGDWIINEDFETAGVPGGWGTATSYSYDNTTVFLNGTQSLSVSGAGGAGSAKISYPANATAVYTMEGYYRKGGDGLTIHTHSDTYVGGTSYNSFYWKNDQVVDVQIGSSAADVQLPLLINTWYRFVFTINTTSGTATAWGYHLNGTLIGTATDAIVSNNLNHNIVDIREGDGSINIDDFSMWEGGYADRPAPPPIPIVDTLNVSNATLPSDNSILYTNIIRFNTTAAAFLPYNCTLYINNTANQTKSMGADSKNINFSVTFANVDASYTYLLGCLDNTTSENTTQKTINLEVDAPIINSVFNGGSSYVSNNLFTLDVDIYDVFISRVDMNDTSGFSYGNDTATNPFNYSATINSSTYPLGSYTLNITACDNPNGSIEVHCSSALHSWNNRGVLVVQATNLLGGGSADNFTVFIDGVNSGTTTTGSVEIINLTNATYRVDIVADSFANGTANVTINLAWQTYNFSLYTENTINFTFKLEETDIIFPPSCTGGFSYNTTADDCYNSTNSSHIIPAVSSEINVEFISTLKSYNYTAYNGTLFASLLTPGAYTIRYTSPGYDPRQYYFNLINKSYTDLTLYLAPLSFDSLTVTVYEQSGLDVIEGAVVYLQRYYLVDNSFRTVDVYVTGAAGNAYFKVDMSNEYYKFIVDYPFGTTRYISEKMYIEENTINLYINLDTVLGTAYFNIEGINGNIAYLSASNEFEASWNDISNVASEYCLYLKEYGYYGQTILNVSCTTTNIGSLTVGGMNENHTYYGVLTANIGGAEYTIKTGWKEFVEDELNAGKSGLLLAAILIMLMAFASSFHILSMIFGTAALLFAKMLGLLPLAWGDVITVVFASLLLAMIIQVYKK